MDSAIKPEPCDELPEVFDIAGRWIGVVKSDGAVNASKHTLLDRLPTPSDAAEAEGPLLRGSVELRGQLLHVRDRPAMHEALADNVCRYLPRAGWAASVDCPG